ncbi:glycosyltransferase family 4 protein [Paludibaculum fermentans]|uniref:glycosyltransferase family 4 protein n=1 Tax=Paludibaculum fermentans TaxID=1473598 RepID=UPI003EBEF6E5
MKVLAVTYGLPFPLSEGCKIRDHNLLRALAAEAEVHLLCFCKDDRFPDDVGPLPGFCSSIETYPVPDRQPPLAVFQHLIAGRPLATFPFYFPEFARRIAELARKHKVDVVQLEHSFLAPYVAAIPPGCLRIQSLHNIGEQQYASMARMKRTSPAAWLKAIAMRGWEAEWTRRFDGVVSVSQPEAEWVRRRAPQPPVCVIPNGVDCASLRPLPEPEAGNDLLFIGTLGYPPNTDAVRWMVEAILPKVRAQVPDIRFVVVGRNPGAGIRALAATGAFELHADVPDILPYYRRCRLSVVPLRAGGGTRLKILESMALERPVVSTAIGCEGLEVVHGEHLLIGDTPEALSGQIVSVLTGEVLRQDLVRNARRFVELNHDWPALGSRLCSFYNQLMTARRQATS